MQRQSEKLEGHPRTVAHPLLHFPHLLQSLRFLGYYSIQRKGVTMSPFFSRKCFYCNEFRISLGRVIASGAPLSIVDGSLGPAERIAEDREHVSPMLVGLAIVHILLVLFWGSPMNFRTALNSA